MSRLLTALSQGMYLHKANIYLPVRASLLLFLVKEITACLRQKMITFHHYNL